MKSSNSNNDQMQCFKNKFRTVYFSYYSGPEVYAMTDGDIKDHFEEFGEVESMTVHRNAKKGEKFGLVQFKTADAAKRLISTKNESMDGTPHSMEVKMADPWYQSDIRPRENNQSNLQSSEAPDADSDSNILNALIDDCLQAVFEHLNLVELANTAEVCKRFAKHAEVVFKRKYGKVEISRLAIPFCWIKPADRAEAAELIARNFGKSIHSLAITPSVFGEEGTFKFINKYFASNLKELILANFNERPMRVLNLAQAVVNVETLVLIKCHSYNIGNAIVAAKNLKVLRMIKCAWWGQPLKHRFDNLEEIFVEKSFFGFSDEVLRNFVNANPTLKKIVINDYEHDEDDYDADIACVRRTITGEFTEMIIEQPVDRERKSQVAKLNGHINTLSQSMPHTMSLKLSLLFLYEIPDDMMMNEFAANRVPVEQLTLDRISIDDDDAVSISQMRTIKSLKFQFTEDIGKDQVVFLAKHLPLLDEVVFKDCGEITINIVKKIVAQAKKLSRLVVDTDLIGGLYIDSDDFNSMLELVKSRPEKVHLHIDTKRGCFVDVDDELQEENKDWLVIDHKIDRLRLLIDHRYESGVDNVYNYDRQDDAKNNAMYEGIEKLLCTNKSVH